MEPTHRLRGWLPHATMLVVLVLAVWLVGRVFAPLAKPVLVAAAIAALTHGILLGPIRRGLDRLCPGLDLFWRRRISAALATLGLVLAAVSPLLLLLVDALGGVHRAWDVGIGLALRDQVVVSQVAEALSHQVAAMRELYPALPFGAEDVKLTIIEALSHSQASDFYAYLFRGGGGLLARLILGLMLIYLFYSRGAELLDRILGFIPFTDQQRQELRRRFSHASLRLLHDTVAMAVLRGCMLGLLAWWLGDFRPIIVAAIAAFVGLVPVVGFASVWIPLAGLLASRDLPIHAAGLALGSIASWWLIGQLGRRWTSALEDGGGWPGLLLFLGLVGGVLSFGLAGVVVGPMAVITLRLLVEFWLPLYGIGRTEPDRDANPVE